MTGVALYFCGKKLALSPANAYSDGGDCNYFLSIKARKDERYYMSIYPVSNRCERWRQQDSKNYSKDAKEKIK